MMDSRRTLARPDAMLLVLLSAPMYTLLESELIMPFAMAAGWEMYWTEPWAGSEPCRVG
jgi:hypothetical protein